jgi:hypothetical protein
MDICVSRHAVEFLTFVPYRLEVPADNGGVAAVDPFTDEQARALVNLEQHYQVWMEAERALAVLPYDLRRREIDGRSCLYETQDRGGDGRSLGPWSPELDARLAGYRAKKAELKARVAASGRRLEETARLGRALRLPALAEEAAEIVREADRRGLLDGQVLVVGTNAMPAYAVEAGGFIRGAPDETQDFDLVWAGPNGGAPALWPMLKAVDPTFTVNMELGFQARNARAYEVEVLVAPSRAESLSCCDQPRAIELPEQEWLLLGHPVDHVVISRGAGPARIVAPDPRWFALQKLWLARQAKRNPLKRPKDLRQGLALLNAVDAAMPQYPLDDDFVASVPEPLLDLFAEWKAQRPERPPPRW